LLRNVFIPTQLLYSYMSQKTIIPINKKNEENRINRINRSDDRCNNTFHMSYKLASSYRVYAKLTGKSLAACIERAIINDMKNNPTDSMFFEVQQQILSTLPSRQEEIRMKLFSREMGFILERLDKVEQDIRKDLVMRLGKLLLKGAEIKNPTEEFVILLEEGLKHI